jgi:hypothetical protein
MGIKQQGHEADRSPVSSADIKNIGAIPTLHPHAFMAWFPDELSIEIILPLLFIDQFTF